MARYLLTRLTQAMAVAPALLTVGLAAESSICPPFGPVFPPPTSPQSQPEVQDAIISIEESLDGFTSQFQSSALAIGVKSIHENEPMLLKHYTPPVSGSSSTREVNEETVFRIGSLTKALTMLSVLKLPGVSLDDPVVKYLPQLQDMQRTSDSEKVVATAWEEITLGALASHISGIGADFASDLTNYPVNWTKLGLPSVNASMSPNCAGLYGIPPCNDTDFFGEFGNHDSVYAAFTTPVYSNIGYSLLAMVVESVSHMTFEAFLRKEILVPLGMNTTSISSIPGAEGQSFVLEGDAYWGSDLGFEDPSGAAYSTLDDLMKFSTAILNYDILSPAATRKWMKPRTSTSAPGTQLGDLWEIYRSNNLTSDKRLVEVYTKSGDLGLYHSQVALIPDYDISITILAAGPQNETTSFTGAGLMSMIATEILPAIESAGRNETSTNFEGTYHDASTNSTLSLVMDDGPGLSITQWTVRGVDFLGHFASFADPLSTPAENATAVPARLYPTDLKSSTQQAWRAVFDTTTPEDKALQDAVFWEGGSCLVWATMDRLVYQHKALDEIIFTLKGSSAAALTLPAFGVGMERVQCGRE